MPDVVLERLQNGVVRGMDIRIITLGEYVSFPYVSVNVIADGKGKEENSAQKCRRKNENQLLFPGHIIGKGFDQTPKKNERKRVKGARKKKVFADRPEMGKTEDRKKKQPRADPKSGSLHPLGPRIFHERYFFL
jgi:hypothetical protein